MTKWHIKELSELTKTSIRMLRHYDKIGLLNPSYREENGYRCYTAPDLAKLQQIIALKYFGFSLSTIKDILQKHTNIYAHLQAQQQVVRKQSEHLQQVQAVLGDVLQRLSPTNAPDLKDIILLIEGYNMPNLREKLKNSWAGQQLNAEQFEDYLFLYEQFPEEFAARDAMLAKINQNLVGDPESEEGEQIVILMHELAIKMRRLFSQHVKLSASLMESIQSGRLTQLEITPEGANWVGRATLAYWLKRWDALYDKIVENLGADPEGVVGKKLADEWTGLIDYYLSAGSRALLNGIILWQEFARQNHEIKSLTSVPTAQEMVKNYHIKLLFNPLAAAWISRALDKHTA